MTTLGTVADLFRFPVKSMRGERLEACRIGPGGLVGGVWSVQVVPSHVQVSASDCSTLSRPPKSTTRPRFAS